MMLEDDVKRAALAGDLAEVAKLLVRAGLVQSHTEAPCPHCGERARLCAAVLWTCMTCGKSGRPGDVIEMLQMGEGPYAPQWKLRWPRAAPDLPRSWADIVESPWPPITNMGPSMQDALMRWGASVGLPAEALGELLYASRLRRGAPILRDHRADSLNHMADHVWGGTRAAQIIIDDPMTQAPDDSS